MFVFRKKSKKRLLWVWKSIWIIEKSNKFTKKFTFSGKNRIYGILRQIFLGHLFTKRLLEVLRRSSVGWNLKKMSVGGKNIKKFTKTTEYFRDGLAWNVNMFIIDQINRKFQRLSNMVIKYVYILKNKHQINLPWVWKFIWNLEKSRKFFISVISSPKIRPNQPKISEIVKHGN